jgi:hypothetical protein
MVTIREYQRAGVINTSPTVPVEPTPRKRSRSVEDHVEWDDKNDINRPNDDLTKEILFPRKKRVRFDVVDNYGRIKTSEAFSNHPRIDNNSLCWWNRHDRSRFIDESNQAIKVFRHSNLEKVRHYLHVYERCSQAPSHSASDFLEKATVCLPSEVRGLEWGIAPSIKTHRREHMEHVLDAQGQVQTLKNASFRERIIANQSLRSSRPSKIMARLLAEGDAMPLEETEVKIKRRSRCKMLPDW